MRVRPHLKFLLFAEPRTFKCLMQPRGIAFLLLLLSLVLHLAWLSEPREVVFDEVHFGRFVSGYLTGQYFIDVHPPLAKLMITGVAVLVGVTPADSFKSIGAPYPDDDFMWLRLLPALFGSVLVPLVYLLALQIGSSRGAALLAGVFALFENALLVQTKFILLDAFLLVFGFLSLYLFSQSMLFCCSRRLGGWLAMGASVSAGLCIATKWTGIGFWGLLLAVGSYSSIKAIRCGGQRCRAILLAYTALVAIPMMIYIASFFIHFKLLPQPGPGNLFMTSRFQASQASNYPMFDFPANLWELHRTMYTSHARTLKHPYGSPWYMWPIMIRPIHYWKDTSFSEGRGVSKDIYLVGNPVVWWASGGITAVFLLALARKSSWQIGRQLFCLKQQAAASNARRVTPTEILLATGYLANLLPFAAVGRVTFLYYYTSSLIFSILIAGVMLGRIQRGRKTLFKALFVLTFLGFLAVSPVTFGINANAWPFRGSKEFISDLLGP
jgi:dolichyl-phosphate-mannose--protein O-mannosyl transferase